ncbi:alkaline phosphatase family protein [Leeia aquatica]|uniref:alkaline phosphatase family protein n=1 Tax=Leeia aquatica TaxID=2725557 RepID=UPI001981A624|nr:alkaline phosphatase family protein [Leeia aquatica]
MDKLVLVLADGLRADTARFYMGYLAALEEGGRAHRTQFPCMLPSLSRPLYATLITGRAPIEHGVVSNDQPGVSCGETLFHQLMQSGKRSAAAAYYFFYEMLSGERYHPYQHRLAAVPAAGLGAACWYHADEYPDSHTLADGEALRQHYQPDFLMIHTMGSDHAGHVHGGGTDAYNMAARVLDMQLALLIPRWHAEGYHVVLTSDHGMHPDRMHGGTQPVERDVPFYWLPHDRSRPALPLAQRDVRAFLARVLLGAG